MNLGERIFELRKASNLSQEEVADKLNVTRQTVSKWENNQSTPDFDKIVPLCELFGIGAEELLTGKKEDEQNESVDKKEEKVLTKQDVREKSAKVVSTSVFIYIASVAFLMVAVPVQKMNPIIASAIFWPTKTAMSMSACIIMAMAYTTQPFQICKTGNLLHLKGWEFGIWSSTQMVMWSVQAMAMIFLDLSIFLVFMRWRQITLAFLITESSIQ